MIEEFEIKDLCDVKGKPGLYLVKGRTNAGVVMRRLTDPKRTVLVKSGIMPFKDVVIYRSADDPVSLESVLERMYELQEDGVEFPKNLAHLTDRWDGSHDLMEEVVPGYDPERFKPGHMDKILKWFTELCLALEMMDDD